MNKKKIVSSNPHNDPGFKGYTMAELRYQRALLALKREYCKENIMETAVKIHHDSPFSSDGQKSLMKNVGGVASKVIGGLNYVDYLLIGFSAFSSIRKVLHFFKRGKKK